MKKSLTKLIASCAAVAAVSTAMAVSASAATYENGTLTPSITSAAETGKQATVLVYKADSADTEATAENIVYIDQAAKTEDLWKTISVTFDEGAKYVIKMGGEGATVASEVYGKADVMIGDVNLDGEIKVNDAVAVIDYYVGNSTLTDDQMTAADAYQDGEIKVNDAVAIIDYYVGNVDKLPVVSAK